MKKFYIFLSVIFTVFGCFCFAAPSMFNLSYYVEWNKVSIYRTANSDWWYADINLKDPQTHDWLHFGEVKISDQIFSYTKQREWTQDIQIIPSDGGDIMALTIPDISWRSSHNAWASSKETTRTVITSVPKTGPSRSLMWVILATFIVFGGYIYIKKRADI